MRHAASDSPASPLSRAALRDLALLVRRLRERGAVQREEHADAAAARPARSDTDCPARQEHDSEPEFELQRDGKLAFNR